MYPTEIIQLVLIPICTWVVYKAGFYSGVENTLQTLEAAGVIEFEEDEENA